MSIVTRWVEKINIFFAFACKAYILIIVMIIKWWTSFPLVSTAATYISHFSFLSPFFWASLFSPFIHLYSFSFQLLRFFNKLLSEWMYIHLFSSHFRSRFLLSAFLTLVTLMMRNVYAWFGMVDDYDLQNNVHSIIIITKTGTTLLLFFLEKWRMTHFLSNKHL